jgi:hypothetical protein
VKCEVRRQWLTDRMQCIVALIQFRAMMQVGFTGAQKNRFVRTDGQNERGWRATEEGSSDGGRLSNDVGSTRFIRAC